MPEGLPLAVTISLAYSMKKMLIDQNFVRVLSACETMGGATAICSDKVRMQCRNLSQLGSLSIQTCNLQTGTLTENRMTVVEGWFAGTKMDHAPSLTELNPQLADDLKMNICLNSKAFLTDTPSGRVGYVGSSTECAMLLMLRSAWGIEYTDVRSKHANDIIQVGVCTKLADF